VDYVTVIGLTAGFITTMGYIPQVVKGYRSKRMDDVSVFMPLVLMIGMGLWLVYGIMLRDVPIVFWNAVSVALNAWIIFMKIRYGRKESGPAAR
jgi:MtN3 and saliva related transmembrane protein